MCEDDAPERGRDRTQCPQAGNSGTISNKDLSDMVRYETAQGAPHSANCPQWGGENERGEGKGAPFRGMTQGMI